jgi:aminoglycoside phosphotransferase (APT) family kinase protein
MPAGRDSASNTTPNAAPKAAQHASTSEAQDLGLQRDTIPVPEHQRVDEAALQAWVEQHVPQFGGPLRLERFAGGQSNPTYRVHAAEGGAFVMRAKPGPQAKLLPSAHAVEREFRVQRALRTAGFPVPEMYALCEDEGVIGRAFYLMEYVVGRVFIEPLLPHQTPAQRSALYDELNRVLAQLHKIAPHAIGLDDYGKPGNFFARQIARWTRQYRASETERIEAMERLMEWLPTAVPTDEEASVVHGDFRLGNVMYHPTEPRIVAVLDWELSTLGHPLADLSYHCMQWHQPPGEMHGLAGAPLAELGIPEEMPYVRDYCRRTGRADIGPWDFYVAYNLFRSASILQGIIKRALDGTASSPDAYRDASRTRAIADLGWSLAERYMRKR